MSQNKGVEHNLFGIQLGIDGLNFTNEFRISKYVALKGEIGLQYITEKITFGDKERIHFIGTNICIEPKYYYNIINRFERSKDTAKNSADFLSLKIGALPDIFHISNVDAVINPSIYIIPMWGIRRNLLDHFNYEIGFGYGYQYFYKASGEIYNVKSRTSPHLNLRVGYVF